MDYVDPTQFVAKAIPVNQPINVGSQPVEIGILPVARIIPNAAPVGASLLERKEFGANASGSKLVIPTVTVRSDGSTVTVYPH